MAGSDWPNPRRAPLYIKRLDRVRVLHLALLRGSLGLAIPLGREGVRVQILEVKHTLDGRCKEFPCDLCLRADRRAILLYRLKGDVVLGGVSMPAGTLTLGHFWQDRPFNVYHWIWPDGETAAYYFNLADSTSIDPQRLEWRDLTVDVMLTPDGKFRVLDEDELPDELDGHLRATIDSTLAYLLAHGRKVAEEVETESRRCLAGQR